MMRPLPSRKVWLPVVPFCAVPVRRPEPSRKVVLLPVVFAEPATLYANKLEGVSSASAGMKLRASVGVGLMWASPFGPIRIDYAIPVKKESTDNVQEFNFGIATRF